MPSFVAKAPERHLQELSIDKLHHPPAVPFIRFHVLQSKLSATIDEHLAISDVEAAE
jgi:hypothetical protein